MNHRETIAKVMPASRKADFNQTVAAFQKRKEKASAAIADAKIDFDKYKAILGDAEVEAIRQEFESYKYTDFEAEKQTELGKVKSALTSTIAAIEAQSASLTTAAATASTELTQLQRTRTTLNTTVDEVAKRHPEIIAELQARIADEDWDTEEKPLDVNALRLQAIEENWDEKALGPLDENMQKDFIDEMTALDAEAAAVADDDELPDVFKELITDSANILGAPLDFASLKAAAASNTVTAADRAITSESTLFREIDMAVEAGKFARAEGLVAIAQELRHTGRLAIDEEFRQLETKKLLLAQAHLTVLVPITAEEIVRRPVTLCFCCVDSIRSILQSRSARGHEKTR
jgi:hypothetical protein